MQPFAAYFSTNVLSPLVIEDAIQDVEAQEKQQKRGHKISRLQTWGGVWLKGLQKWNNDEKIH